MNILLLHISIHYRKESKSEPLHLRLTQFHLKKAKNVIVEGNCCWKICTIRSHCQYLLPDSQKIEVQIKHIRKIDVVSCRKNDPEPNVNNSATITPKVVNLDMILTLFLFCYFGILIMVCKINDNK